MTKKEQDQRLKTLYTLACRFLEERIGCEALRQKVGHYRERRLDNMADVFWQLIYSLQNKRNMGRSIGNVDLLWPFLFCFDPHSTHAHYRGDWRKLFETVRASHKPPGPMNIENANSYWVIFSKGILAAAAFLSRFSSFNEFDAFVRRFAFNDTSLAALPLLLEQEIYGLGFPLACDFLKECGYTDYVKPDVHIKAIFYESGVVSGTDSYEVFKAMVRMARLCNELPVIVDHVFWLIGSGRFGDDNVKITGQRAAFLQQIRSKMDPK